MILILTAPTSVYTNNSCLVNADLTHDSNYNVSDPAASDHDPTSGHIPDGIPIVFDPGTMGTMDIINRTSSSGKTSSTFTAGSTPGIAIINVNVDGFILPVTINILVHIPQAVNDTVTTNENTSVSGNVSTNDIPSGDGGNVWSVDTPPVNGFLVFNNDGSYNYTPTENWYGTDSFTYTLTDVNGDIPTATVTINVNKVDNAPVLNLITDQTTNENQLLQFTITGTDPDGDSLTYYSLNLPGGANLNSTTGVVTWTPLYTQSGVYPITFYVTDGNLTANQTINITVNNIDRAPILNTITDQTTNINQLLQFTITGTDLDGDSLTYYSLNLPGGATINATTGTFTWTPTYTQSGTYKTNFIVSDGTLSNNETISIIVKNVDRAPILNLISNKTVNEGSSLKFVVSGKDPDGDIIKYSVSKLPTGATFNKTNGDFIWTPKSTQIGSYYLTFTVSDGTLKNNEKIKITVNKVDIFDNSIQIENKGKSKIYYNYEITITEPNKTIIKKKYLRILKCW